MRTTLSVKHTTPADLAKNLRSLAAKLDADALKPGADLTIGNTRVQVATQESPIRAWARANGFPVAGRGRYSKELQDAYDKAMKEQKRAENKAKREAAAERKAAKLAAASA